MFRKTFAEINLNNLSENFKAIKSRLSDNHFICPMVKANAYGHGMIPVAEALSAQEAQNFGVALVEEGIELRQAGFKQNILTFASYDNEAVKVLGNHSLTPVVGAVEDLERLSRSSTELHVHLMFNTGMNRLGMASQDIPRIKKILADNPQLKLQGVCTHLAIAEDLLLTESYSEEQLMDFNLIRKTFAQRDLIFHALNSSGFIGVFNQEKFKTFRDLGVRPGLFLYGDQSLNHGELKTKPVMSLKSQLIKIQQLKKGQGVSYGHLWRAKEDGFVGIVGMGYADGVFRQLNQGGSFLIDGQKAPIIGAVCMDYTMVDLGLWVKNLDQARGLIGREALLFGESDQGHALISDIARFAGTNSYDIMSRVGVRVPRVYN